MKGLVSTGRNSTPESTQYQSATPFLESTWYHWTFRVVLECSNLAQCPKASRECTGLHPAVRGTQLNEFFRNPYLLHNFSAKICIKNHHFDQKDIKTGWELGSQSTPMLFLPRPGALDQTSMASGSLRIRWCVDGQKLDSHAEKLISPEFRLGANFGGGEKDGENGESQPFRIMLLATQTGGKHGAGFKKAKGRGNIEIKCLGSYEGPSISLLVTVGSGSRKQKARELVKHNFGEKSCCPLAKGGRDPFVWDLKAALSKETKCVEVCIEVLPE